MLRLFCHSFFYCSETLLGSLYNAILLLCAHAWGCVHAMYKCATPTLDLIAIIIMYCAQDTPTLTFSKGDVAMALQFVSNPVLYYALQMLSLLV